MRLLFLALLAASLFGPMVAKAAPVPVKPDVFDKYLKEEPPTACEKYCEVSFDWPIYANGPEVHYDWKLCRDQEVNLYEETETAAFGNDFKDAYITVNLDNNVCELNNNIVRYGLLITKDALTKGVPITAPFGSFVPVKKITNQIKFSKTIDGCEVNLQNFQNNFREIVDRKGKIIHTDQGNISGNISAQFALQISSFVDNNNRCPQAGDPGFENFINDGNTNTVFKTKEVFKKAYCCCALNIEPLTQTRSCNQVTSFDNEPCDPLPGYTFEKKPVPDDSKECADYDTVTEKDYAGKANEFGIPIDRLKQEALALNPGNFKSVGTLIGKAINLLLMFIGTILLALYSYAGFQWMTAAGNSERIESAKQILVWSTLGVGLMLASYILVQTIFDSLSLTNVPPVGTCVGKFTNAASNKSCNKKVTRQDCVDDASCQWQ